MNASCATTATCWSNCFCTSDRRSSINASQHLLKNPDTGWRVSGHDHWQSRHYEQCLADFDDYLCATNRPYAPWHIIDSTHRKQSELECLTILCDSLQAALDAKAEGKTIGSQSFPEFSPQQPVLPAGSDAKTTRGRP